MYTYIYMYLKRKNNVVTELKNTVQFTFQKRA